MYSFILNQWKLRKYNETNIANCVKKAFITQEQADEILETQQIEAATE